MPAHLIHKGFVEAYVYAIIVAGVVRYIGKGRRYRALEHFRIARDLNERRAKVEKVKALPFHNKLAKAIRNGAAVDYEIIINGLQDDAAYEREVIEIAKCAPGQLWNVHCGGSGGDADLTRRLWTDPTFREKTVAAARKGRENPEYLVRARKTANAQWSDEDFRERWTKQHRSIWDDPIKAAERRALLKKVWDDPEKTARKSTLVKSQWTPERKAAMAENRRRAWADPEFRKRASASIKASKARNDRPEQGGILHSARAKGV